MRRKPHKISAWLTYDAFSYIKKVMKLRHLNLTDALEYIITHEDITPQDFSTYLHCPHREAYPQDPNFIRCFKDDSKRGRLIEKDICQACGLLKVIEVPLKTKQKLEEEISQLKIEKETLIKPVKLQETLENLEKCISSLNSIEIPIKKLSKEIAEQSQLSKVQAQPKVEYRDRIVEKPQCIERTTEKEIQKIVYKPHPLEGLQILCKAGKGFVSVTEECMKNCKDILECPYYSSIVVEQKIPEGAKLRFVDSNTSA